MQKRQRNSERSDDAIELIMYDDQSSHRNLKCVMAWPSCHSQRLLFEVTRWVSQQKSSYRLQLQNWTIQRITWSNGKVDVAPRTLNFAFRRNFFNWWNRDQVPWQKAKFWHEFRRMLVKLHWMPSNFQILFLVQYGIHRRFYLLTYLS